MGQAKIKSGGPNGLYNVEIVKHAGKSAARLSAITARLAALGDPSGSPAIPGLITAAQTAIETAITALQEAVAGLDRAIKNDKTPIPSLVAVARWDNDGNGTCTSITPGPSCLVGQYTLTFGTTIPGDYETSPEIPDQMGWMVSSPGGYYLPSTRTGSYTSAEINFTTAEGSEPFESGDAFDIDVTEDTRVPVTSITVATAAVITKQAELTQKRRDLSTLKAERMSLVKEQARLQTAMAVENRTGVWCTDLTEDLAVGATVGTMEMNGVDDQIILTPGGEVSKSIGLLQHVGVSTPSAVFLNKARLPAWQKWKPTYRVGTIISINYNTDKCDVGIEAQFSEERGLAINQAGEAWTIEVAANQGWLDFAARNPNNPLVTNTEDTQITMTPQLKADLEAVQNNVNSRYNYKLDKDQHGSLEQWDIMGEGGSGDCEDFALTKADKLLNLGYPASAIFIVTCTKDGEGHAYLIVQTDKGILVLDNQYKNVMKEEDIQYTNRKKLLGLTCKVSGVKLSNVPIEYMDGINADAFMPDDRVVVQFTGQAWESPKVVGFETNPRGGAPLLVTEKIFTLTGSYVVPITMYQLTLNPSGYIRSSEKTTMPVFTSLRKSAVTGKYVGLYKLSSFGAHHVVIVDPDSGELGAYYELGTGPYFTSYSVGYKQVDNLKEYHYFQVQETAFGTVKIITLQLMAGAFQFISEITITPMFSTYGIGLPSLVLENGTVFLATTTMFLDAPDGWNTPIFQENCLVQYGDMVVWSFYFTGTSDFRPQLRIAPINNLSAYTTLLTHEYGTYAKYMSVSCVHNRAIVFVSKDYIYVSPTQPQYEVKEEPKFVVFNLASSPIGALLYEIPTKLTAGEYINNIYATLSN